MIDLSQIRSRLTAVAELKGMVDGDSATQRPGIKSGGGAAAAGHPLSQIVNEMRKGGEGKKGAGGGRGRTGGGSSSDLDALASLVHYGKAKPSQVWSLLALVQRYCRALPTPERVRGEVTAPLLSATLTAVSAQDLTASARALEQLLDQGGATGDDKARALTPALAAAQAAAEESEEEEEIS